MTRIGVVPSVVQVSVTRIRVGIGVCFLISYRIYMVIYLSYEVSFRQIRLQEVKFFRKKLCCHYLSNLATPGVATL